MQRDILFVLVCLREFVYVYSVFSRVLELSLSAVATFGCHVTIHAREQYWTLPISLLGCLSFRPWLLYALYRLGAYMILYIAIHDIISIYIYIYIYMADSIWHW